MNQMLWPLTVESILRMQHDLIEEFGGKHGIRNREVIESAVESADQTFDGNELYPTIFEKAATYAFQLCEGQGFIDGNKRIALMSALVFLDINDHVIHEQFQDRLAEAMYDVAAKKLSREGLAELLRELYCDSLPRKP